LVALLGCLLITPQALWAQRVTIQDGRISVDLKEASLVSVARDIERQSGISFKGDESLVEESVSLAFKDLPLEQGIKRILATVNYSLLYDSRGEISEVMIMSEGSAPAGSQPQIRKAPVRPGAPAQQRPVVRRPGTTTPFVPGQRRPPVPARSPTPTPRSIPQRPVQTPPSVPQAPEESNLPEPFRGFESAPPGEGGSEGPLHPAFRSIEPPEAPAAEPVSPKAIPRPPTPAAKSVRSAEEQASKEEPSSSPRQD
jgi:hypothetical protein